MGYTYLNLLAHTFVHHNKDRSVHFLTSVRNKKTFAHTHTYIENSRTESIYLSSMISYLLMRENRLMSNCVKKASPRSVFVFPSVYTISSFYLASLILLHDDDVRLLSSSRPPAVLIIWKMNLFMHNVNSLLSWYTYPEFT
jgi:hypothetical protein